MPEIVANRAELLQELREHLVYLGINPPPGPALWLLIDILRSFSGLVLWTEDRREQEGS